MLLVGAAALLLAVRLADRDRVSDVLLRRMGFSARDLALARTWEVAWVVGSAVVAAVVAVIALTLVPTMVEPDVSLAPVTRPIPGVPDLGLLLAGGGGDDCRRRRRRPPAGRTHRRCGGAAWQRLRCRTASAAVVCHGLVKVYRSATGETHALRGIDLSLLRGVVTVVAGPSGSGKSSLLHLLAARDRPSAGRLDVLGSDLADASARELRDLRRRRIGFVAQRASGALFPHLTAAEQLRQVASLRGGAAEDVDRALATVSLEHRGNHLPSASSGGEQQRLAVALALVGAPGAGRRRRADRRARPRQRRPGAHRAGARRPRRQPRWWSPATTTGSSRGPTGCCGCGTASCRRRRHGPVRRSR